jgi:hypothetical protein
MVPKQVNAAPVRTAHFRNDTSTLQLWLSANQYGVRNCATPPRLAKLITETGIHQALEEADTPTAEINKIWIDRSFATWDQGR